MTDRRQPGVWYLTPGFNWSEVETKQLLVAGRVSLCVDPNSFGYETVSQGPAGGHLANSLGFASLGSVTL